MTHLLPGSGMGLLLAGGVLLQERRGRQERLSASRAVEITALLESISEAAVVIDASGAILDVNQEAAEMVSRTREQLRGTSAEALGKLIRDQEAGPGTPSIFHRALKGEVVRQERRALRDARGAQLELLVSSSPIRNQAGAVLGVMIIAHDVTEQTQLQQRLGDLERHHAVGQMAAALTHDFSNLLETIGQAAAVLEMDDKNLPPAQRSELLHLISSAVRGGSELVSRVREYLRTGTGIMAPVDIGRILEESVELTRPLWQKMHVGVTRRLLPSGKVKAHAADLRRVFTNLIINAIDAMPNGGELAVSCQPSQGSVVVVISDTGRGIPLSQQRDVFRPYFTTKVHGTGLGLSGAQKYILSQGGNISFTSQEGKGTRFTVSLPQLPAETNSNAA